MWHVIWNRQCDMLVMWNRQCELRYETANVTSDMKHPMWHVMWNRKSDMRYKTANGTYDMKPPMWHVMWNRQCVMWYCVHLYPFDDSVIVLIKSVQTGGLKLGQYCTDYRTVLKRPVQFWGQNCNKDSTVLKSYCPQVFGWFSCVSSATWIR